MHFPEYPGFPLQDLMPDDGEFLILQLRYDPFQQFFRNIRMVPQDILEDEVIRKARILPSLFMRRRFYVTRHPYHLCHITYPLCLYVVPQITEDKKNHSDVSE